MTRLVVRRRVPIVADVTNDDAEISHRSLISSVMRKSPRDLSILMFPPPLCWPYHEQRLKEEVVDLFRAAALPRARPAASMARGCKNKHPSSGVVPRERVGERHAYEKNFIIISLL